MSFSRLANVLWAGGFFGNAGLLAVLIAKKRWRQFPVLTVISGFELLQTITLFCLSRYSPPRAYYWGFWDFVAVDFLLQILLVFEIANASFRPQGVLLVKLNLPLCLLVASGVGIAAVVSMSASPSVTDKWDLWEIRTSLFTSLLMCELCAMLMGYSNRLGLQWRTHALAITQGYTTWAVIALLADGLSAVTGWHGDLAAIEHIRMFAYIGMLVYWTLLLSFPEHRKPAPDLKLIRSLAAVFSQTGSHQ